MQIASNWSESEFDEEFSDQESPNYDDSENSNVEGSVRPRMDERDVERRHGRGGANPAFLGGVVNRGNKGTK